MVENFMNGEVGCLEALTSGVQFSEGYQRRLSIYNKGIFTYLCDFRVSILNPSGFGWFILILGFPCLIFGLILSQFAVAVALIRLIHMIIGNASIFH